MARAAGNSCHCKRTRVMANPFPRARSRRHRVPRTDVDARARLTRTYLLPVTYIHIWRERYTRRGALSMHNRNDHYHNHCHYRPRRPACPPCARPMSAPPARTTASRLPASLDFRNVVQHARGGRSSDESRSRGHIRRCVLYTRTPLARSPVCRFAVASLQGALAGAHPARLARTCACDAHFDHSVGTSANPLLLAVPANRLGTATC
jgi:hypothetical protein